MIRVNDINEACTIAEVLMLNNYWVKICKSPVIGDNHYLIIFKEDEE